MNNENLFTFSNILSKDSEPIDRKKKTEYDNFLRSEINRLSKMVHQLLTEPMSVTEKVQDNAISTSLLFALDEKGLNSIKDKFLKESRVFKQRKPVLKHGKSVDLKQLDGIIFRLQKCTDISYFNLCDPEEKLDILSLIYNQKETIQKLNEEQMEQLINKLGDRGIKLDKLALCHDLSLLWKFFLNFNLHPNTLGEIVNKIQAVFRKEVESFAK